jgi:uncharacterized protein YbjT (DUF2867 family)
MADRKIIAVTGATGAQAGGLARAILDDPSGEFALRAVTRNPGKDAARALADRGAEVVQADLDDEASLRSAFDGAYGAYCLTNFCTSTARKETAQGGNLARAAAAAGVQHAIWSTFEDTRKSIPLEDNRMPTLQERYKVVHFDAKADANHFFTDAGVPTTFLLTSFYWENFIFFGLGPKRGENGVLAVTYPMGDKKLPSIAVEDIGKCSYGIFKRGGELVGQTVGVAGEHPTGAEIAAAFTRALGEEVRYNDVPPDVFRSFGFHGADDIGNMFQFKADFNDLYSGNRSVEFSRSLNPELQTLDQWMAANKDRIPLGGAG